MRLKKFADQLVCAYSLEKSKKLKAERGIDFEDVKAALSCRKVFELVQHPNKSKYAHQEVMYVEIDNYVYAVPCVRKNDGSLFLKTLYPSRRATAFYLKEEE